MIVITCIYKNMNTGKVAVEMVKDGIPCVLPLQETILLAKDISNAVLVKGKFFKHKKGTPKFARKEFGNEKANRRDSEQEACGRREVDGRGRKEVQGGTKKKKTGRIKVNSVTEESDAVLRERPVTSNDRYSTPCPIIRNVVNGNFVRPDVFVYAFKLNKARLDQSIRYYVDTPSIKKLKDSKCLSFDNDRAFVAVNPDGNICALMRSPKSELRNFMMIALAHAVNNGGEKLDCYSNEGFGLGNMYCSFGFLPVCRLKYNEELATKTQNSNMLMRPDVYFFMYVGDNAQDMVQLHVAGDYPAFEDYTFIPYATDYPTWQNQSGYAGDDYGFALHVRDVVLDKWKEKYKPSFRERLTSFVKYILKDMK